MGANLSKNFRATKSGQVLQKYYTYTANLQVMWSYLYQCPGLSPSCPNKLNEQVTQSFMSVKQLVLYTVAFVLASTSRFPTHPTDASCRAEDGQVKILGAHTGGPGREPSLRFCAGCGRGQLIHAAQVEQHGLLQKGLRIRLQRGLQALHCTGQVAGIHAADALVVGRDVVSRVLPQDRIKLRLCTCISKCTP